jgi:hypothetical protein
MIEFRHVAPAAHDEAIPFSMLLKDFEFPVMTLGVHRAVVMAVTEP